jgi:parvulin-like peptidyl-prolyl isomerase
LPPLSDIPMSEIRAYYEAHHGDFKEPERRRVSHIVMTNEAKARQVLESAKRADPKGWGELVKKNSVAARATATPDTPPEFAGDLGMVTAPAAGESDNKKVPEPVRAAVFEIAELGGVLDRVVNDRGRFHIVRLSGKSPARDRSFADAERTIRVALLRERILAAEAAFEQELRKKHPVRIDEAALSRVKVPGQAAEGSKSPEGRP